MVASAMWSSASASAPPLCIKRSTTLAPPSFISRCPARPSPPPPPPSPLRLCFRCSYAASDVKEAFSSIPIDVIADVKSEKIVVLGGSGFVGSAICKAAVSKGIEVISLSRSGRPLSEEAWVDQVTWIAGDVFNVNWDEILVGATAVVSTIGGFGNEEQMKKKNGEANILAGGAAKEHGDAFNITWDDVLAGASAVVSTIGGFANEEQMKKINGEANILAVGAAKGHGVPKFILISVHDYNLPSFMLSSLGYFTGKRSAESEVLSKYPNSGVVLRPGLIYGKRKVDGYETPLDLIGEPVEKLLLTVENFTKPLGSIPGSDVLLAPPVSVDDVAFAVVNAVGDDDFFGVFTIEQIREAAAKVRS